MFWLNKQYSTKRLRQLVVSIVLISMAPLAVAEKPKDGDTFVMAAFDELPSLMIAAHAIRQYILEQHGIKLVYKVIPSRRMPKALLDGMIDGAAVSDITVYNRELFLHSTYPTHVYQVYVYYKTSPDWQPSWPASESFKKAKGATKNYTYFTTRGFDMTQISRYSSGIKMVNAGRADYWIEAFSLNDPNLKALMKEPQEGYRLELLYPNPVRVAFADNDRGLYFKRILDDGYRQLLKDPEKFREIFLGPFAKSPNGSVILDNMLEDYLNYLHSILPDSFEEP